eukprot:32802-Prorocentrum_minimum.AAC.2
MGVKDYTGLSEPYQTGGCTRNHNGTSPSFLLYEHSHSRAKHNSSEYKIAPSLTVRHSKDTIAKRCATMRAITRYASAWLPRYSESVENIDAMVKKQGERFRKESGCALRKASETEGSVCRQIEVTTRQESLVSYPLKTPVTTEIDLTSYVAESAWQN